MTVGLEERMQGVLDRLNIPLTVSWLPEDKKNVHGEIEESSRTMFLYDSKEEAAWQTFFHEACEFKLKEVTRGYRMIVNSLIETIEKMCYERKESFLEFLPRLVEATEEART